MSLPVPAAAPIVIHDRRGADDFAELAQVLAHQGPVTFVYAPTTITHHYAAPAPAPYPGGPGHLGIDVDATGYSGGYQPPAYVAPMPDVPERRTLAPLTFLLSGWSTLAAALLTAVTGGNGVAIGATVTALAAAGISFAAITRERT